MILRTCLVQNIPWGGSRHVGGRRFTWDVSRRCWGRGAGTTDRRGARPDAWVRWAVGGEGGAGYPRLCRRTPRASRRSITLTALLLTLSVPCPRASRWHLYRHDRWPIQTVMVRRIAIIGNISITKIRCKSIHPLNLIRIVVYLSIKKFELILTCTVFV